MADQEAAPNVEDVIVICLYPDFCFKDHRIVAYDIVARGGADEACSRDVNITGQKPVMSAHAFRRSRATVRRPQASRAASSRATHGPAPIQPRTTPPGTSG